jgi:dipeptidyl aminopeptidase/acylaminoacyl peptidase
MPYAAAMTNAASWRRSMPKAQVCPYGSWKSPITSDLIVSTTYGLGDLTAQGQEILWVESRPSEGGRYVIIRRGPEGSTEELTPAPFNVRTRVHEYGGAAYVVGEGAIYFSNFSDNRLYRQAGKSAPVALTAPAAVRYADLVIDRGRNRIICVCEDHSRPDKEPVNTVAAVSLAGDSLPVTLVGGADFYSNPRLSPDHQRLAWLSWNHPNLPWDGTELWAGEIGEDGSMSSLLRVAGGPNESIFQPEWSEDGALYFVSDRTGWWNLYRYKDSAVEPLTEKELEFGAPQWVFGTSTYAFVRPDQLICSYADHGIWRLALLDTNTRALQPIEWPYTEIRAVRSASGRGFLCAGSPTEPFSIIELDPVSHRFEVLRRSSSVEVDPDYLSIPRPIEFPTENGLTAYGLFYAPKNKDFEGPGDRRPPLIVMSHGGPTAAASSALSLPVQYWTSRGFAVLDVNYGGSTGYGRSYRERLNGNWGVVDVDDCVNGAKFLASQGLVDPDRLIIRGGSAGGYTTLAALTFRDVFKAGASYYGISDLEALEKEGHKFESQYSHTLVAPYPERRDLYIERSPIHYTDRLSCPIILFQGLEDKVVPPNQAEMMFAAVKAKGIPVAYVSFEGEQHGFRKAENIKRSLDGEMYFYSRVFGFDLAEAIEPVHIENLRE